MSDNQLNIKITAGLNTKDSVTRINADIKKIEGQLKQLRLQAKLDNSKTNAEIQKQITALNKQKRQLYVDLKIRQKDLKKQYKQAVSQIDQKPVEIEVKTNNAQKQLSGLSNSVKSANNETVSLGNTLNKTLNNIGLVVSAQTALNTIRKAAQEATEAVKEYDKYATNLSMITGGSRESSNKTIADLSEKSFDFKVDISELEGAYETLLRTGKAAEEIDDYLKSTVYLSKIGFENMDVSAENLVTIANAYKLPSDEIENVVSKLSALDTASMTVAGKLSTAMSETAQNAQLAGLNIDRLGAIISGLRDTTGKSESELATSLNGILTRLYNVKLGKYEIELEDGSTENITESLNNVEKMLKTVGMNIRTSKGEFKDVTDIIDELVEKWDKLNDVQKNSIGFTFAGTHHKNTFIALVENWNRINELTEVSADSAGQAKRKYDAYLDSIESKSAALNNAMKNLWNNLIPNGFVGDITDAATGLVQFTDEYQVLQTAIKSAAFYALAKGIVSAKNGFAGMITDVKNVSYAMDMVSSSSAMTKEQFASFSLVLSGLSDKQLKLVLSNSNLTESEMVKALTIDGTTEAEARQKLATLGITQANQQAAVSTFSLNGSMKALFATISANPVMVLTMAFTALVSIYQKVQREQEEARKNAVESAEKYNEQATSLQNLRQEYINIVDSESDVSKKTEELNKWKETLIETYGFEKEAIEKVNLEREKGLGLLDDEITKNRINSAETWLTENKDSYEDAKKKLTSRNNSSENAVIPQANVVTQVTKDALNDFSDNFNDILKQFSISNPTKDNPLAQIKLKGSNTLEQYENLNEILNEITSIKVTKGLNDAEEELYNSLLAKQKAYKKVVTDDIKDIYETGNKYTNAIKLFYFETENGINFDNVTQDTYKEFRDKFLESLGLGDKKDSTAFSLDIEQVLLDMMPDFEKSYRGIEDSVTDEIQNVADTTAESSETASKSLEDLQKSYDDLSKSASSFTKVQKTFTSALEEQEKHGQLSASTIQELTDAGYAQALVVDSETGAVTLNKQAYEQLNKQKRKAIELDLEAEKFDLVTQLNEEKDAIADLTKEYEALNQVPNKTQDITDRISAITLELTKRGENITAISELIDKINGSVSSLDAPEFGSDKTEKPQSVLNFEAEYAEKNHKIIMDEMKEDENYYSWLLSAAHTAYDGLADYQDDLWKYEEKVYEWRKKNEQDLFDQKIENAKTLADKILNDKVEVPEEAKKLAEFNKKMQKEYGLGNVDLTKRPKVSADAMRKAGYDAEDGETATVYTSSTFMWQGDDKNGKNVVVHYTPILPDGTVLDEKSLNEYLDSINESEDLLKADTKGIILKVDTDFDISDEDLKSLETDKPTENIQSIIKACDDWDIALHEVQAEWLDLSDAAEKAGTTAANKWDYAREIVNGYITDTQNRIKELENSGGKDNKDKIKSLKKDLESYKDDLDEIDEKEIKFNVEQTKKDLKKIDKEIEKIENDSITSDGTKLFGKEKWDTIESMYVSAAQKVQDQIDAIVKSGVKGNEDLLEELGETLDDYGDKIAELPKSAAKEEQEYLKNQKEKASKQIDEEINAVQKKIDALKKVNEKEQEALEIEKARQELEKASQSTRQVYGADGSISFKVDNEKVKEAQENLDKLMQEKQTSILEDQKDLLETEKENSEKRFDILLDVLDKYLNPDQGKSNSDVWKELAHTEGATYKNGVWTDKDGKAIDINKLLETSETAKKEDNLGVGKKPDDTRDALKGSLRKGNNKDDVIRGHLTRQNIGNETSDVKDVADTTGSVVESFFSNLEKKLGLKDGSLSLDKVSDVLNGSNKMGYNPYANMTERVGTVGSEYANANNVNNNNVTNITIGDIVINNPVGNSDDLAKELRANLHNAADRIIYSNLR